MDKIFVVHQYVTVGCEVTTTLCPLFFETREAAEKYIRERIKDRVDCCRKDAKCEVYNGGRCLRVSYHDTVDYEYEIMDLFEGEDVYGHKEVD